MPQTWPELSATTLTEQVYEVLRDRIISGAWSGGHFIREQEISTKLGVRAGAQDLTGKYGVGARLELNRDRLRVRIVQAGYTV